MNHSRVATSQTLTTIGAVLLVCAGVLLYGTVRMVLDPASRQQVINAASDPEMVTGLPVDVHELALLGFGVYALYGVLFTYGGWRLRRDPEWSPLPDRLDEDGG